MSAHTSVQPHKLLGTFFPSVTIKPYNPAYRFNSWVLATTLTPYTASVIYRKCPDTPSEWRFGDLTLTREVRPARHREPWLYRSHCAGRHSCVILLCPDNERALSTLIISPRTHLATPARAWPALHSGQNCEVLTLFLPLDAFEGPDAALPACCIDAAVGPGALLADFMRQLAGQLVHIPEDRAVLLASATRTLVTACTATTLAPLAPVTPSVTCGMVERARLVVRQNMGSPDFGQPQLARLLAMSRSKLYRLLDGDGGVAHFINRERLMQAWRDLTVRGKAASVHAIANQVGFRDHSTFSRAFRREFGCSPTEARERALIAQPDPVGITGPDLMHAHALPRDPAGEWDEQPRIGDSVLIRPRTSVDSLSQDA